MVSLMPIIYHWTISTAPLEIIAHGLGLRGVAAILLRHDGRTEATYRGPLSELTRVDWVRAEELLREAMR